MFAGVMGAWINESGKVGQQEWLNYTCTTTPTTNSI
jgi:hypothetical protein